MAKDMTPGEKAALFLTLGEQLVELVKETGLLKPKRKAVRRKRKVKAKPAVEKKVPKKAEKPAINKRRRDDDDDVPQDR